MKPDDAVVEGLRVIARFQPQVFINDYAVPIDGAYDFDVTDQIKSMTRAAAEAIEDYDYSSDDLWHAYCASNPGKHHDGPFSVCVTTSIDKYFRSVE